MFKKIIIFILALFLAAPMTPADDSSIIPVLWLFAINNSLDNVEINNFDNIYEMNGFWHSRNAQNTVKTYSLE